MTQAVYITILKWKHGAYTERSNRIRFRACESLNGLIYINLSYVSHNWLRNDQVNQCQLEYEYRKEAMQQM